MIAATAPNVSTPIRRGFVTVGDRQVHYRRAGEGDPVVLVHESPLSSRSLVDLVAKLSARFCVLALDSPGYGSSDALALEQPEIPDYADAMAETLSALGIERCGVFGAHTGAQIALELARRHPERVTTAVLDGLLVIDDDERRELLANYLPAFAPQIDGGHLLALWTRYRDQHLFFPWYRRELASRLDIDVPSPEHLHDGVMDLLRAGPGYAVAYAAAFRHVVGPPLPDLQVPVTVTARDDDLLAAHLDRLGSLPPSANVQRLGRDRDAWAERIGDLLGEHAAVRHAPQAPVVTPLRRGVTRDYVDTRSGRLLVRRLGTTGDRPLLMLHASPGSAAMLVPLATELARHRAVVALDTLGNGDSDKPGWTEGALADYAPVVADAVERLGLGTVDVYGQHTGALIAVELAIQRPELVHRTVLDGVLILSEEERDELLRRYTPPFTPRDDGTHLLAAWHMVRNQNLFWPWFNNTRSGIRRVEPLDAQRLHEAFVDLMKSGETYPISYRAAFSYPTVERLAQLATPALMIARETDPLRESTQRASALARNAALQRFAGDDRALAAMIGRFLGG